MPRYRVLCEQWVQETCAVEVEADNEADARIKAENEDGCKHEWGLGCEDPRNFHIYGVTHEGS